ncbi:unnamed protein product [Lactuca saligna]|uniref:Uncharacterized protein n=1 Tax=Lactuca saligna TaxID=75948 RepID=A0AA36ESE0_LACSI|nr:unnamed protein product [Lactuca saligna]
MAEEGYKVSLHMYDLSEGLARQLSMSFLKKAIEGICEVAQFLVGLSIPYCILNLPNALQVIRPSKSEQLFGMEWLRCCLIVGAPTISLLLKLQKISKFNCDISQVCALHYLMVAKWRATGDMDFKVNNRLIKWHGESSEPIALTALGASGDLAPDFDVLLGVG